MSTVVITDEDTELLAALKAKGMAYGVKVTKDINSPDYVLGSYVSFHKFRGRAMEETGKLCNLYFERPNAFMMVQL